MIKWGMIKCQRDSLFQKAVENLISKRSTLLERKGVRRIKRPTRDSVM